LAATSGVHTHEQALKLLLAGADVTMMASTLYLNGPEHLESMLSGITRWLEDRGYDSIEQMKGSVSHQNAEDPMAFERANYMRMLTSFTSVYDWRGAAREGSPGGALA